MKMHKRNHSYIRTKLPRARNTCVDDSNSQVPLYVTYLNKYAVTKFNKYRFPQYPVETILFSLMAQKQKYNCFEKWDCFLMDRATLRSKMKSGEIVVSQLKLDSLGRIISRHLNVKLTQFRAHIQDRIQSGSYSLNMSVDIAGKPYYLVDDETIEFFQSCSLPQLF